VLARARRNRDVIDRLSEVTSLEDVTGKRTLTLPVNEVKKMLGPVPAFQKRNHIPESVWTGAA
jgi:hypothetical protein